MRVGLDVSPLDQTRAGTARYLNQLASSADVELVRLASRGRGRLATLFRDSVWYPFVLPRLARRAEVEVLHCPTFRAPLESSIPLVVTVHDLAVLRHPETFNLWTRRYSRYCVPRVVQAARVIVTISEFTRRELVQLLDVPDGKIRVIPNGVSDVFAPTGPVAEGDYVLAVGTLEPRKNLERLAQATRRLGVELRVAGPRGWGGVTLDGGGARLLGEVSDEELAALYRGARCLAYPSIYEGFGLPVVEAMACGTPVVTSRGGATEEVAGGAAVLVDPLDPISIASGIEQATFRREELVHRGLERARAFRWEDAVQATVEVYREVAAA